MNETASGREESYISKSDSEEGYHVGAVEDGFTDADTPKEGCGVGEDSESEGEEDWEDR